MRHTLVIAGFIAAAAAVSAEDQGRLLASGARDVLHHEFPYAASPANDSPDDKRTDIMVDDDAVVEMSPFRVEEMRPRHAHELQEKWAQHERLRPKAALVKHIGHPQAVVLQPPYLHDEYPSPSSNRAGGVMASLPVLSLRW